MHKPFLPMLPLLIAACAGVGVQSNAGPHLVTGEWGGTHAALRLRPDGGTVEYDCAHGTLDGPLLTDANGAFRVAGTHVHEHGGPARMGEALPHEPAVCQGWIRDGRMTLEVRTAATALGSNTLRKEAPAQLFKCLQPSNLPLADPESGSPSPPSPRSSWCRASTTSSSSRSWPGSCRRRSATRRAGSASCWPR